MLLTTALPTMNTCGHNEDETTKTIFIRMRNFNGNIPMEIPSSISSSSSSRDSTINSIQDILIRFHEIVFSNAYTNYIHGGQLFLTRTQKHTQKKEFVSVTSLNTLKDMDILIYEPSSMIQSLITQGQIIPTLHPRPQQELYPQYPHGPQSSSSISHAFSKLNTNDPQSSSDCESPSLKRKGRTKSVANNVERVHRYSPILETMGDHLSPREKALIEDLLIEGDDLVVDAMEQFSISRNTTSLKRVLHGPQLKFAMENLSINPKVGSSAIEDTKVENPQKSIRPSMIIETNTSDISDLNPFLIPPLKPKHNGRPTIVLEDPPSNINLPSINEKPPKSNSREELSSLNNVPFWSDTQPEVFSVAQLLEYRIPVYTNFYESYELGPNLGSGKSSIVKEATNKATGSQVAVKIIKKYEMLEVRFLKRELEILYLLNFKGIVRLLAIYENSQNIFLVLEKCEAELFEYIDKNGPLMEAVTRNIVKQLIATVAYLHDQNIVHRDIKPENILISQLTAENEIMETKLTDFGIARKLIIGRDGNQTLTPHENYLEAETNPLESDISGKSQVHNRSTRAHTKCGTRDYIAPEVMSSKGYGTEADLWSVGIVTYVLLSGCVPVFLPVQNGGASGDRTLKKVVFSEDVWSGISDSCKNFIESLLVRNPEQRSTAQEALQHPWIKEE